jgi:glutamyl-tRNA synthetase
MSVRVRFAPSPTGNLHIGGARTCLFSWLYARKMKGTFILRIEDTDMVRSKKEYLDEILNSVKWLGMDWDEIYYQSARFDLYKEYAQKLIDMGKAEKKDGAVFFKYENIDVTIDDLVRGPIVFKELPKDEEVIIKSDGAPTYNFCCVIDDAMMKMTHVIRGEDHISNTPKQIMIYRALGFEPPKFAHVPLIMSPDGGRLSKRFGATAVSEYRNMGYLSPAIVNYLMLLGWAPGENREIITLDEAIALFDVKDIHKTGAAFSMDKLNWVNGEYIRKFSIPQLTDALLDFYQNKGFIPENTSREYLEKVVALFHQRLTILDDFKALAKFCFYDNYEYSADCAPVLEKKMIKEVAVLIEKIQKLDNFDHTAVELEFRAACVECGIKVKELVHPVRVALTGLRIGPGLFELMSVIGKEKVIARLSKLNETWSNCPA